jgi:two-component system NtrC family response regulator
MKRQRWMGNIRELKNIIERAVILSSDDILSADLLPDEIRNPPLAGHNGEAASIKSLDELERQHILSVLKQAGNNKTQAAKLLGIGAATLYRKLKEYGLE